MQRDIGKPSDFGWDGIAGTRFTFPPGTIFLSDKIYETVVLGHWQRAAKDSGLWEIGSKWDEPRDRPRLKFSSCGTGRGIPGRNWQTPWVEETGLRLWRDQGTWHSQDRVPERRRLHTERIPEICRGSSWRLQLSTDQHVRVRKLLEAEESTVWRD